MLNQTVTVPFPQGDPTFPEPTDGEWVCYKCKTRNEDGRVICKGCGTRG